MADRNTNTRMTARNARFLRGRKRESYDDDDDDVKRSLTRELEVAAEPTRSDVVMSPVEKKRKTSPAREGSVEIVEPAQASRSPKRFDTVDVPRKRTTRVLRSDAPRINASASPPAFGEKGTKISLPEPLKFTWDSFTRKDISLADLRGIENARPDVVRALKVIPEREGEPSEHLNAWLGGEVFAVPSGLPCDVTFVHSFEELIYLDTAAWMLFDEASADLDYLSPLTQIEGYDAFPFAYHDDAAAVKRWKTAQGMRRMLKIVADERDWLLAHSDGVDKTVFFPQSQLHRALGVHDFERSPAYLDDHDCSSGFVVPLPWVVRFFAGVVSASPSEVVRDRYDAWVKLEWAYLVGEAYAYELFKHLRAWVMPRGTIEELARLWARFEDINVAPQAPVEKFRWRTIATFVSRAYELRHCAESTRDYCTGRRTERLWFDPQAGVVRARENRFRRSASDRRREALVQSQAPSVTQSGGATHALLSLSELAQMPLVSEVLNVEYESEQRVVDVIMSLAAALSAAHVHVRTLRNQVEHLEERESEWCRRAANEKREADSNRHALTVAQNRCSSAEATLKRQYETFAEYYYRAQDAEARVKELERRLNAKGVESQAPGSSLRTTIGRHVSPPLPLRIVPAPPENVDRDEPMRSQEAAPSRPAVPGWSLADRHRRAPAPYIRPSVPRAPSFTFDRDGDYPTSPREE